MKVKKLINLVARYIWGACGIMLLILLVCYFNSVASVVASKFIMPILIAFLICFVIAIGVYFIHFIWMLQEKVGFSKDYAINCIIMSAAFLIITMIQNGEPIRYVLGIVFVFLLFGILEIGKYVYSWKINDLQIQKTRGDE